MDDVERHYEQHLAPIYAWSLGGAEAAIAEGARWLATLPLPPAPARVLDLGAGFGATAIPLADAGHEVLAIDSSSALVAALQASAGARAIRCHTGEIVETLRRDVEPGWPLVLCVGDTLPHLASHAEVDAMLGEVARVLSRDGLAVLSYRPKRELAPHERFVLVRADARRTLTAYLEPIDDERQRVWDVIHERDGEHTTMRVSAYPKLRVEPSWVEARCAAHGLCVERAEPYRGMVVQLLRPAR